VRQQAGLRRYGWEVGLIGLTAVWGASFPLVKCAIERCPELRGGLGLASIQRPTTPLLYLSLRFALAAVLVGGASVRELRSLTRRQLGIGLVIGFTLCAGYTFQTFGLQRTTASNAGFITGLYVVLVPLLGAIWFRRVPAASTGIGAVLATVGLLLLAAPSGVSIGLGDSLVLVCALSYAIHILLLGRFAGSAPLRALVALQMGVTAVVTGLISVVSERAPVPTESGIWVSIVVTAVLASALGSFLQTGAQRFIPPARAAVIMTMESPFAALFGFLMLDERLRARGWIGAGLIVAGMLVAELWAPAREEL